MPWRGMERRRRNSAQVLISAVHVGKCFLHAPVLLLWEWNAPLPNGPELGWAQCRSGRFGQQKKFLPLAKREIQFPSHCTDWVTAINLYSPCVLPSRTLTSKRCIKCIYSTNITNIVTEYFKHGIYSPFFSLQNAVCFIILTYLVPVLFTFYIQGVLKLKK